MPIPVALAISSGIGALIPLISEAVRDKPDPEAASLLVKSKRDEMIDMKVGAGLARATAEKAVDEEIARAVKEAEKQGQFNTPIGEMVMGALLGGAGGWAAGKVLPKIAPGMAAKLGMGGAGAAATGAVAKKADDAASQVGDLVSAEVAPKARAVSQSQIESMTSGPFPGRPDLAREFAGAAPVRGVETAAADAMTTPFPRPQRGTQTIYEEFGFSPKTTELDLRNEFGQDIDLADRMGRMARLRRPSGD